MMNSILAPIMEHIKSEAPKEACGVVIQVGTFAEYMPCRNISTSPLEEFILNPSDYATAQDRGPILFVVHSHPDNSLPSSFDIASCGKGRIPWLVVDASSGAFTKVPAGRVLPLIGRPFLHGVVDCFELMKDYYSETFDIHLGDIYRPDDWWEDPSMNLYIDNAEAWGFYKVQDIKFGDVILMQVHANVPNHAAIYIGDEKIIHHLAGRLSRVDPYGGYWVKHTHSIYRHKDGPS